MVAAIIEASHDEKGIIWPEKVAPFKFSLINIHPQDENVTKFVDELYEKMLNLNIEVLYDDTKERAGSKFATHDLIGIPYHIIVGKEKFAENLIELKDRKTQKSKIVSIENFDNILRGDNIDF
jgi:prolyl-tRNA synthetase